MCCLNTVQQDCVKTFLCKYYVVHRAFSSSPPTLLPFLTSRGPLCPPDSFTSMECQISIRGSLKLGAMYERKHDICLSEMALLSKYESFQLYLCLWKLQSFLLACDGIPAHFVHTPHFLLVKESFHCVHTPTLKSIVLQHQSWFHSSAVVNSECYSKYGWVSISVICWLQCGNIIFFFREDCRSLETVPEPRPGCCVPGLSVMRTAWAALWVELAKAC